MVPGAIARHERPCIGQRVVAGQAWVRVLPPRCMLAMGAKPGAASPSVDAILPQQVFHCARPITQRMGCLRPRPAPWRAVAQPGLDLIKQRLKVTFYRGLACLVGRSRPFQSLPNPCQFPADPLPEPFQSLADPLPETFRSLAKSLPNRCQKCRHEQGQDAR